MKKFLIEIKVQFPGTHNWVNADTEGISDYLQYPHRHNFLVVMRKEVTHGDRDIEFFEFQKRVYAFLETRFETVADGAKDLGTMSCEQVAEILFDKFGLYSCWVYEDGENGGGITR